MHIAYPGVYVSYVTRCVERGRRGSEIGWVRVSVICVRRVQDLVQYDAAAGSVGEIAGMGKRWEYREVCVGNFGGQR